jgi:hypothetical protein
MWDRDLWCAPFENREECGSLDGVGEERVGQPPTIESGALDIEFEGKAGIAVPPHPTYEAWTIAGSRGLKIVCTPGGKLAVWSPVRNGVQ